MRAPPIATRNDKWGGGTYHSGQLLIEMVFLSDLGMVECQADGCRRHEGWSFRHVVVVLQNAFQVVVGGIPHGWGGVGEEEESHEERVGGGSGELKAERVEDAVFHVKELSVRVSVPGLVNKVPDFGRVDFLVLAGDEEGRRSDELQPMAVDADAGKVAIKDVDGKVQRFRVQFKFQVRFHNPIDQNRAHDWSDLGLFVHVGTHQGSSLSIQSDHTICKLRL